MEVLSEFTEDKVRDALYLTHDALYDTHIVKAIEKLFGDNQGSNAQVTTLSPLFPLRFVKVYYT